MMASIWPGSTWPVTLSNITLSAFSFFTADCIAIVADQSIEPRPYGRNCYHQRRGEISSAPAKVPVPQVHRCMDVCCLVTPFCQ